MNPLGLREQDCVIRAISLALNKPYSEVINMIDFNGITHMCDNLNLNCYSKLLEEDFNLEPIECYGMSVKEFADSHPVGTYLIRMDAHLSTLIDSIVYDIWNCSNEILTNAWRVD